MKLLTVEIFLIASIFLECVFGSIIKIGRFKENNTLGFKEVRTKDDNKMIHKVVETHLNATNIKPTSKTEIILTENELSKLKELLRNRTVNDLGRRRLITLNKENGRPVINQVKEIINTNISNITGNARNVSKGEMLNQTESKDNIRGKSNQKTPSSVFIKSPTLRSKNAKFNYAELRKKIQEFIRNGGDMSTESHKYNTKLLAHSAETEGKQNIKQCEGSCDNIVHAEVNISNPMFPSREFNVMKNTSNSQKIEDSLDNANSPCCGISINLLVGNNLTIQKYFVSCSQNKTSENVDLYTNSNKSNVNNTQHITTPAHQNVEHKTENTISLLHGISGRSTISYTETTVETDTFSTEVNNTETDSSATENSPSADTDIAVSQPNRTAQEAFPGEKHNHVESETSTTEYRICETTEIGSGTHQSGKSDIFGTENNLPFESHQNTVETNHFTETDVVSDTNKDFATKNDMDDRTQHSPVFCPPKIKDTSTRKSFRPGSTHGAEVVQITENPLEPVKPIDCQPSESAQAENHASVAPIPVNFPGENLTPNSIELMTNPFLSQDNCSTMFMDMNEFFLEENTTLQESLNASNDSFLWQDEDLELSDIDTGEPITFPDNP